VTGGHGGNGCMSFMSLFANEWAGPDGGDGGNGGHVLFQGKILVLFSEYATLLPDKSMIFVVLHGMNHKRVVGL